jgi:ABC-type ATPase involved in cell division
MPKIELINYTQTPTDPGNGFTNIHFTLATGDICHLRSRCPEDAQLFLRTLAMLAQPVSGTYRFNGQKQNLQDYRATLDHKRKIGYVAPDMALISNLTIRQNLLLMRYYFENDLSIDLSNTAKALCRDFDLDGKIDKRPADLSSIEILEIIFIREVIKNPEIMLLHLPEDIIQHSHIHLLEKHFSEWIRIGRPVVFASYDQSIIRQFANRKLMLSGGALTDAATRCAGEGP